MTANHTTITGPNTREIRSVPRRWTANRATRMATATGITHASNARGGDLEPLDGAEHGDRRGDQAVAVEQRGAEHAEGDDRPLGARRQPVAWAAAAPSGRGCRPRRGCRRASRAARYLTEMMIDSAQKTTDATP